MPPRNVLTIPELLLNVLSHAGLSDPSDRLHLGLTCHSMWAVVRTEIWRTVDIRCLFGLLSDIGDDTKIGELSLSKSDTMTLMRYTPLIRVLTIGYPLCLQRMSPEDEETLSYSVTAHSYMNTVLCTLKLLGSCREVSPVFPHVDHLVVPVNIVRRVPDDMLAQLAPSLIPILQMEHCPALKVLDVPVGMSRKHLHFDQFRHTTASLLKAFDACGNLNDISLLFFPQDMQNRMSDQHHYEDMFGDFMSTHQFVTYLNIYGFPCSSATVYKAGSLPSLQSFSTDNGPNLLYSFQSSTRPASLSPHGFFRSLRALLLDRETIVDSHYDFFNAIESPNLQWLSLSYLQVTCRRLIQLLHLVASRWSSTLLEFDLYLDRPPTDRDNDRPAGLIQPLISCHYLQRFWLMFIHERAPEWSTLDELIDDVSRAWPSIRDLQVNIRADATRTSLIHIAKRCQWLGHLSLPVDFDTVVDTLGDSDDGRVPTCSLRTFTDLEHRTLFGHTHENATFLFSLFPSLTEVLGPVEHLEEVEAALAALKRQAYLGAVETKEALNPWL